MTTLEGAVQGKVAGTYLHGSLLPKNPGLADEVITWALSSRSPLHARRSGAARRPAALRGRRRSSTCATPAATLLLGRGVHPKIVSEMLGHSQIAVTLDLYSHVTPAMQREATVAMDALLAR